MTHLLSLRPGPLYQRSKPERNPAYLAFIRKLPCSVCCKTWGIEAAHFGSHGISQRASDLNTLPLCRACHRTGPHAYHKLGPREFAAFHKIEPAALIAQLNQFWKEKMEGTAA